MSTIFFAKIVLFSKLLTQAFAGDPKPFVYSPSNSVQADVAITFAPRGSEYRKRDIMEGVTEFNRQYLSGETKARPLVYLHVNGTTRIIYHWDINKRRHNLHTGCLRIKVC